MRKRIFLLAISFLFVGILHATIINVPGDYSTIQTGIDSSSVGDTVLVQPGTYVENINYNGKNITVASLFLTTQDTSYISQTVIDGNQNGTVVIFESGEDISAILTGFTITNGHIASGQPGSYGAGICCKDSSPTIANSFIVDNFSHNDGAGIYCSDCSPTLSNLIISKNTTEWDGAGLFCDYAHPTLYRVVICNNTATWAGAGVYLTSCSEPTFTNVTITENNSYDSDNYAGFQLAHDASPTLVNCILWNNTPQEILLTSVCSIDITYSDIKGGWTGVGNMNIDPLFVNPLDGDFHLTTESPCIDSGDPNSPPDPDGSISDIGSYYFDPNYFYANFTASPTVGEVPLEVYFSDLSNGNIISWEWDFQNDGVIDSYEQNPTFVYQNKGTYSVSLTVQSDTEEDRLIKENYIAATTNIVVDGYAYLDNQSIHDGIKILFIRTTPSIISDSTYTDSSGHFSINLQNGLFNISYSKENYHDITYENVILNSDTTLTTSTLIPVGTGIINVPGDFLSIQEAIDNSYEGNIVLVDTGRYYENINFSGKSITVSSLFYIQQDSSYITHTIIDANNNGSPVIFNHLEDSLSCLSGFTITGSSYMSDYGGIACLYSSPKLKNLIVSGNNAYFYGGGICCYNADPIIENVVIKNNTVTLWDGGGFFCTEGSKPTLINVSIYNNSAGIFGGGFACWSNSQPSLYNVDIHDNSADQCGGVYCHNSIVFITNATICHNSSVMHHKSSGIYSVYMANVYVTNCIIWDNWPAEIQTNIGGSITITYSDIKDGWSGTGNIDSDPLFVDPQNGDFHLTWANFPIPDLTKSPCIDTGDPSSPVDPDGTRADMGAYYFNQPEFGVDIPTSLEANILHQNFPNPTKNSTIIQYSLKHNSHVMISIYNIKGQLISTLVNETKPKGEYSVIFDAEALSSGVYFYKLQTEDMSEIKKMIVIR